MTLVRTFDKPMGLAVDGSRLALGTRKEVCHVRNAPDIAPQIEPEGKHDACFLPRSSHITGDIGIHEIVWAGDELWVVSNAVLVPGDAQPRLQLRAALATAVYLGTRCRGPLSSQRSGRHRR